MNTSWVDRPGTITEENARSLLLGYLSCDEELTAYASGTGEEVPPGIAGTAVCRKVLQLSRFTLQMHGPEGRFICYPVIQVDARWLSCPLGMLPVPGATQGGCWSVLPAFALEMLPSVVRAALKGGARQYEREFINASLGLDRRLRSHHLGTTDSAEVE